MEILERERERDWTVEKEKRKEEELMNPAFLASLSTFLSCLCRASC